MKLTIVGNGSMAHALARGLHKNFELEFIARDEDVFEALFNEYKADTISLQGKIDVTGKTLLLCVKPYALENVATKLHGEARALYSILAGTSMQVLNDAIKAQHTIRAMPNVAAAYGSSATALTGDSALKDESMEIFDAIGRSIWLDSEKALDIATAVAGSGPAYLALVAEAMMDGGVRQGLKRDESRALVNALFEGFAPLLNDSKHPALIKDSVMSPGGTTAAGYSALESHAVRYGFIEAIEKAFMVTQKNK